MDFWMYLVQWLTITVITVGIFILGYIFGYKDLMIKTAKNLIEKGEKIEPAEVGVIPIERISDNE